MNNSIQNVTHAAQRKMVEKLVDTALSKMSKDREESLLKIVDLAETFFGDSVSKQQYDTIREMIKDPDNRWMNFVNRVLDETNPHVAKMAALNLGYEAAFRGTKITRYFIRNIYLLHKKYCSSGAYANAGTEKYMIEGIRYVRSDKLHINRCYCSNLINVLI